MSVEEKPPTANRRNVSVLLTMSHLFDSHCCGCLTTKSKAGTEGAETGRQQGRASIDRGRRWPQWLIHVHRHLTRTSRLGFTATVQHGHYTHRHEMQARMGALSRMGAFALRAAHAEDIGFLRWHPARRSVCDYCWASPLQKRPLAGSQSLGPACPHAGVDEERFEYPVGVRSKSSANIPLLRLIARPPSPPDRRGAAAGTGKGAGTGMSAAWPAGR